MDLADPVRLLWADDDSLDSLDPLGQDLEDAGFRLTRVVDYVGATDALKDSSIKSLLLDVILPHEQGSGSLAYDLGMTLAEYAASKGIRTIVFLTVVRQDEVFDKYVDLRKRFHPHVTFDFFDKTQLMETNVFNDLVNRLNSKK